MSRIGKQPIQIPSGVECKIEKGTFKVKGPKGTLERTLHEKIEVQIEGSEIQIKRSDDERSSRSLHGLTRTLVDNMVMGVTKGFTKQLNIVGVGYRVELKGKDLQLLLGFSHPVLFPAPPGISFEVEPKANIIKVNGIDKEQVGQASANIRKLRPPEPYKGKGIMYANERIVRKAGKTAAAK